MGKQYPSLFGSAEQRQLFSLACDTVESEAHAKFAGTDDIGWRSYIQSLGDELAHIEDTLRSESLAFSVKTIDYRRKQDV